MADKAVSDKTSVRSVELDNTSSVENANSTQEKAPKQEYIEYVGSASRREITVDAWAKIGVKATKDTNWSFTNGYKLPKKDFPPEALKYLLDTPGEKSFRVVTE